MEISLEAPASYPTNVFKPKSRNFSTGHVQIDIYLDRVDISNPGGLVSGLERKDLGKRSMPRNPLLMDLLLRIDKVEKVGSGIGRIHKAMKEYGLKAKFEISDGWFSVVFPREAKTASQEISLKLHRRFRAAYSRERAGRRTWRPSCQSAGMHSGKQ